jgi:segregation and condensation protein A
LAYQVKVDVFEGPFDLLLYLIRKNEMDIYTLSISEITSQYLEYIKQMQQMDLEVAGEFLVIAASLIYIKSQRLLPQLPGAEPDEELEQTEAELLARLQEYQKFKELGGQIWKMAEDRQRLFTRDEPLPDISDPADIPVNVTLTDLVLAYRNIARFISPQSIREVAHDEVTVEQKIDLLRDLVTKQSLVHFSSLRKDMKDKIELVVTVLAILELCRLKHLSIRQPSVFGEIYISKYQQIHDLLTNTSITEPSPIPNASPELN